MNARSFNIDQGKTLANRICLRLPSTDNENPQSIIIRTRDRGRCTLSQWIVSLEVIYHEYKDIWDADIDGLELPCKREPGNPHDPSAV